MGSGVSVQGACLHTELAKPADASDCPNFDAAKAEVVRLRSVLAGQAHPNGGLKGDTSRLRKLLALRKNLSEAEVRLSEPYVGPIPPDILEAFTAIRAASSDAELAKLCTAALRRNELAFEDYRLSNDSAETQDQKHDDADLYSVAKVDAHLHCSAMMSSSKLRRFLLDIYERDADRELDDGSGKTVGSVLEGSGLLASKTDDMGTIATRGMFRNFEEFNQAFSPFSSKVLKNLIFKTQIFGGEYLAEFVAQNAKKRRQVQRIPRAPLLDQGEESQRVGDAR